MENNIPETFTVFKLPSKHQKKLRTSNMAERVNKEIRRRTKVVGIFPNSQSCLRLITSILLEISDDWITGAAYLDMSA
jgi:transposase-like protein